MRKFVSLLIAFTFNFFCTASIRVDFGVATASAPAAGWTAWELPSSNLAPLAISKSFTDDMGTSGNVTVSVTSEAFASYARNNGYNGDGAFSPATPLEFWRDGLFVFGASSKAKAMVITIEGLKAGVYVFTAYAGYRNYGTFESTADIYVNGQYSGLDATTYYRGGVPTAASFLETNIPRKVGFTVANDNDPVSIEFLRLTKEDFGMNGFELNN